jgi:hypothetical protein
MCTERAVRGYGHSRGTGVVEAHECRYGDLLAVKRIRPSRPSAGHDYRASVAAAYMAGPDRRRGSSSKMWDRLFSLPLFLIYYVGTISM